MFTGRLAEKKDFQRSGEGWYGDTDFVSHRQVLVRFSVQNDLVKEYRHISSGWKGVGKEEEVIDRSDMKTQ